MIKKLVSGFTLSVCLIALLAGFHMLTPEPASAFGYCETLTLCSEINPWGSLTLLGSCVHPDTFDCYQRFRDQNFTECIRPCPW